MKRHLVTRTRRADPDEPGRADAAAKLARGADGTMASRPIRRPALIAATTAAVGLLGVITGASSPRPNATAAPLAAVMTDMSAGNAGASPGPAIMPAGCEGSLASLATATAARCSSISYLSLPTSPLPPSPCRNLIFAAARVLGGDPTSWLVSMLDSGGQVGQTLDQAILDRLVMIRTIVQRTDSADPQRTIDLDSLNEVIADAESQPCSTTACSSTELDTVEHGSTPDDALAASAGWYWLCASPPIGDIN